MKKLLLIITFLVIGICTNLSAQDNITLMVKAVSTENGVYLRWLPTDMATWEKGKTIGYKITRFEIGDNNIDFSAGDAFASKTVIDTSILPYTIQAWDLQLPNNDKAAIVRDIYHNTNLDYVPSPQRNLYDAAQHNEYEESKYIFASIISEQDYSIAQAAGLAYIDDDVATDHKYRYIVSINMDQDSIASMGYTEVLNTGTLQLPAIDKPIGEGEDHAASLGWEIRSHREDFSFYNIQRSDDGGLTFQNRNDEPFIFASEVEDDPEFAYFADTLELNNFTYVYRIQGISPFGFTSPASDTIHVVGRPAKLAVELEINELEFITADELVLHWTNMDDSLNQYFTHYNILRLLDIQGDIEQLNSSPIDKSVRSFTITDAPSAAYYKLEAHDINGHRYRSIAYLGQSPDTEAPAMPTGLEGSVYQDGTIELEWSENTEEDLLGYKVFYSNVKTAEFTQWTKDVVKEPAYTKQVTTDVATDSIYISILAVDKRYNFSERTAPIALKRPDVHPPSSPVLSFLLPREEGIRIAFQPSSSSDVDHHEIQRRPKGSNNWTTLISFAPQNDLPELPLMQGETMPSRYIDDDELALRYYDYRIVAIDGSDNISSSAIRSVKPYDDGNRGKIVDIRSFLIDDPANPTLGGGSGSTLQGGVTGANKIVRLQWMYSTPYPSSLKEFKIYYKEEIGASGSLIVVNTPRWVLLKTISSIEAEQAAIHYGMTGYVWQHNPKLPSPIKYKYKVMAYHQDGGFSEYSSEVQAFMAN